ncbi:LuxR C-terminal-related transcriptional regulator [Streptomyces sp. cmx-4-9]|uniref:LuxR C-terminal-related transcriptional regulator n=1 Tax=Streptomyces sp. cmx-4-9 TaxID=2790941 RepID=UPI0039812DC0
MRLVIAEDLLLLREGLIRLLTATGHEVLAGVDSGPDLITAVDMHRPDLALIDVRLPPGFRDEGLRAAIEVRARHTPTLPVIILSQYVERTYAAELLADGHGAVGYLLKDRVTDIDAFLDALDRVAAGGTALDPEVVAQIFARNSQDTGLARLTPREHEVLALMAQGLSNSAIAERLVLAPVSVEKHISNILAKLDLPLTHDTHRRVQAVLTYLNA